MDLKINQLNRLKGELVIPGDKSISHRSIILGSLADGKTRVKGFLESEDCLNTLAAFRAMGVTIEKIRPGEYIIEGVGLYGLKEPEQVIDCGNSGTSMRLLAGLLAPQNFYTVLTGDHSLRHRPMDRVIEPLNRMGAKIWARKGKYAPLSIQGSKLQGINYSLPVASAQVKSAILLAGLYADGDINLIEPGLSRDHTERMLIGFGVDLQKDGNKIHLSGETEKRLYPQDLQIPGDISSAAFFITAGLITSGSEILLKNVGLNPTRSGFIEVVKKMGGEIEFLNPRKMSGEPVADILVKSSKLHGITIEGEIIPRLIDELPIIAVLASQAEGKTIIRDAAELRVKETDRIKAMASELTKLGVEIEELPDGMVVQGPARIRGGVKVHSYGDHRIAMSLAIAGLVADSEIIIQESQCINTSFPEFVKILRSLY
ncbi:3-phosphoshikimate 1-carboxyvinyltransferase [Anoxybacter fermentans]|uniref:3-phosphoshikimate 1-carboxyvinyltransferase n=1 Tax=Anoxybacter fermentans TaxID=1323375 RepID=A0A3S9T0Q4_9FIRM|nr:3-phosphoshikimate 1-carboxyvinyltransferase [Anoxybacter fermentans]AZR74186.1 3-phosphoshikimate 1-carboxyvinyltransferase [Anoxybacter fermentans]